MTIHPVAFLLLVLSPLLVSSMDDIAYFPENGHYYQLVTLDKSITYDDAKTLASSKSHNSKTGYVVTIGTLSEQQFLSSYLNQLNVVPAGPSDYPTIWCGAQKSNDSWMWIASGRMSNSFFTPSTGQCAGGAYCNWNNSSPSNFPASKPCAQIFLNNANGPTPGQWRPTACTNVSQALVVEYDASQTCSPGYTYRTAKGWCEDVNECTSNSKICGASYQCVNTIGSYRCDDIDECQNTSICLSGYQCVNSNGSYACTDIDECSQTPSVCMGGYTCANTVGSYQCNDINECIANSSLCAKGYVCENNPGSYSCNDINECELPHPPCTFGTKCVNTVGSYTCDSLYYQIQSAYNQLVMDFKLVSGTNRIITNYISNSTTQLWSFTPEGFMVNANNGYVVDAEGGLVYAGVRAILWPRKRIEQANNQLWMYDFPTNYWYSQNYDVVLDIYHAQYTPGAEICLFTPKNTTDTPQGNTNQRWVLIESSQKP